NGLVVSNLLLEDDLKYLKGELGGINIGVLKTKLTAVGNLILCNDRGAVVSYLLGRENLRVLQDILGVEAVPMKLAERSYVGSLAAATNVGGLVHVDADEDDLATLSNILRVSVMTGTVNGGLRYVRSSIVANSSGVVVGARTTGPELMTVTRIFGQ
ncbi:MAG: translation initiation factor IF-6, partial [Nitrososphaerota archaeon]